MKLIWLCVFFDRWFYARIQTLHRKQVWFSFSLSRRIYCTDLRFILQLFDVSRTTQSRSTTRRRARRTTQNSHFGTQNTHFLFMILLNFFHFQLKIKASRTTRQRGEGQKRHEIDFVHFEIEINRSKIHFQTNNRTKHAISVSFSWCCDWLQRCNRLKIRRRWFDWNIELSHECAQI